VTANSVTVAVSVTAVSSSNGLLATALDLDHPTLLNSVEARPDDLSLLAALADEGTLAFLKKEGIMGWQKFRKNPLASIGRFVLGATGITELGKLLKAGHTLAFGSAGRYKIRKILTVLGARPVLNKLRMIRDGLLAQIKADAAVGAEQIKSTSASFARKKRVHTIAQVIERFNGGLTALEKVLHTFLTDRNNQLALVDLTPLTEAQKRIGTVDDVSKEIRSSDLRSSPATRAMAYRQAQEGGQAPRSEAPDSSFTPGGPSYGRGRRDAVWSREMPRVLPPRQ
jgi:hypothetical protein